MQVETKIFNDRDSLSRAAAERWLVIYRESVARRGLFHVALAGGSTPRQLYRILASPEFSTAIDWQRVHLFFGDERAVPPDHPDSNFRMARESLLDHVPVPDSNVHRMETESGDLEDVATRYEGLLKELVPANEEGVPQLDLVLLGIGPDGHTASLFPDTDILEQRERCVAPVYVEQKGTWRISITFPVIDSARHVLFLAAGEDKRRVIEQILSSSRDGSPLPVQMLDPEGEVELYLDAEAAGGPRTSAPGTEMLV